MMRRVLVVALLVIGGCASQEPRYAVDGPFLPRSDAERSHAERATLKYVQQASDQDLRFDRPLKALHNPMPDYPRELRDAKVAGDVRVLFNIGTDGRVTNAQIVGNPPAPLAELSLAAVRQWRFEPPLVDGRPIEIGAIQSFRFR